MEFKEVVKNRYSCRSYSDKPVSRQDLLEIAQTGKLSPSGCNAQRWTLIIVDDTEKCGVIGEALCDNEMRINTFAKDIPAYIAILKQPARNPNERQKKLLACSSHDIDIGIILQQMVLAATDKGIANIILGWYDRNSVKSALNIPEDMEIGALLGLGYAKNPPKSRTPRLEDEVIIKYNSFSGCQNSARPEN